jgi:phosphate transport system substrate-binding protein
MPFTKTTHTSTAVSQIVNRRPSAVDNTFTPARFATFTKTTHQSNLRSPLFRAGCRRSEEIARRLRRSNAFTFPSHFGASTTPLHSKGATPVRLNRTLIATLVIALTLAVPAAASAKRLIIDGSTAMLPLVQKLATAYHKANPKIPAPKVGGGQTAIGISDASKGRVDIGDASRDPIVGVDPKGLIFSKVARDGVCVITNAANPLTNLTQGTVQSIFTGSIRDWSNVPGAQVSGPVDLFDRDGASGTQDAFQNIFLGENVKISPSATAKSSEGLEVNSVASDKSAVGFVSFAATINSNVHTVNYGGIPCTLRNAKSGQYLGVRNFWFVTKKTGTSPDAIKFIKWVTKPGNATVRKIVSSEWISIH